jgi:hypothetical protein
MLAVSFNLENSIFAFNFSAGFADDFGFEIKLIG